MEDVSLKVDEESVPITVGKDSETEQSEQQEKQLNEEVVVSVSTDTDAVVVEEMKVDEKPDAVPNDAVNEMAGDPAKLVEIESKPEKETAAVIVEEKQIELRDIEECDTGGDEVPDVLEMTASNSTTETLEPPANQVVEKNTLDETQSELEAVEAVRELNVEQIESQQQPDVVAIDDDDDDEDEDGINDEDDDEDGDDEDDDEDDEGVSNATLNDDEDRQSDLYKAKDKTTSSAVHLPHPLDDFDDDYDEMDDEDETVDGLKDDSNTAVVIGSSDDDDQPPQKLHKTAKKYEDVDEELDYDDDDLDEDDDEYDDDDLMNAVVTSATKTLPSSDFSSPVKKIYRPDSIRSAREREADQISVLKRGINYGRIAKKKSLNWLYNKKKREAYKLILPRNRQRITTVAMRSDQSGGLLHLKISPPSVTSIAQKHLIKQPPSTPIISRTESLVSISVTPQKTVKEEYVIDLDSSPEKSNQEQSTPRKQSDEQQDSETDVKKPPDNKEEEQQNSTMQQTDKVRDSIQKSTEEVQEDKLVSRLNFEQNKENLQSNEALKKGRDEVSSKQEIAPKDANASEQIMDTAEEISESTLKAEELTTSTATPLITDIKEEKIDQESALPPTVDVSEASKVVIEDVPENETTRSTSAHQPTGITSSKRRRSSSGTHDSNKVSKPNSGISTSGEHDDDEEYIHPTKKLREELQSNYPAHDRILNEYIEKTSNDSIDSIQRHIEQMLSEIQTLNDMIKAKEIEWNNMLHLKKVKEEICFRLTRRKQCMEIMATKVGEAISSALDEDYLNNASNIAVAKTPPSQKNPQLSSTPIQGAINSISSNICNFTAVSSSSSAVPTSAQLIIQNRANMKSSDLVKEKANTQRLHRNILPKPTTTSPTSASVNQQSNSTNGPCASSSSTQPILNSYLTSADSVHQLFDMMNGHHSNHGGLQNGGSSGNNNSQAAMVGRQGPFKDVRSIIADFRQQHPEVVPRRGRRVKNSNNSNLSDSNTILGNALKSDTNSRPSSNDSSSHSLSNPNPPATNNSNTVNSFKDVLAPFAKSQGAASLRSTGGQQQNPPYPEVTLHPVSAPIAASGGDQPTGSLLHGYLTKFPRPNDSAANTKTAANQTSANYISNFSPTLARLLTAPERISASAGASGHHGSNSGGGDGCVNNAHHSISGFGVNLSKVVGHNSEITITPVINSMHQQSILQQQLQQQQLKEVLARAANANSVKDEHFLKLSSFASAPAGNDDDAEDSVDRLVIDEGVDAMGGADEHQRIAPHAIGQEFNENEVPVCQGCKKHEAQFVCAGCGNQWYCSRECQVTAWDDHSEVCTATKQIRNNFNVLKSRDLVRGDQFYIVRRRKRNKFYPQY